MEPWEEGSVGAPQSAAPTDAWAAAMAAVAARPIAFWRAAIDTRRFLHCPSKEQDADGRTDAGRDGGKE